MATLDQDEIEELMGALLDLRTQLRNLQWFGEINRRGFVKITKKLDKKVPNTTTQHRYLSTKVRSSTLCQGKQHRPSAGRDQQMAFRPRRRPEF